MADRRTTWQRYTHSDLHWRLYHKHELLSHDDDDIELTEGQALFCPYYVPLEGKLGADWGVIVNPESQRFGLLVFEHWWCGCPSAADDDELVPHHDEGDQTGTQWEAR